MPTLEKISYFFDLLPVLVFLLFIKKIKEKPIWVIFIYSLYSFINNSFILHYNDKNIDVSNLLYFFTLFETLLFATILYLILKNKLAKKIIIGVSVIFALIGTYIITLGHLSSFDSKQTSVECIIIIFFCLYYFYEQLTSPDVEFIYNSYKFWVVIALLLYLGGAFFLFVYAAQLPTKERITYWPILLISSIIRNLLFAFAIYLSTRKREDEDSYESQF